MLRSWTTKLRPYVFILNIGDNWFSWSEAAAHLLRQGEPRVEILLTLGSRKASGPHAELRVFAIPQRFLRFLEIDRKDCPEWFELTDPGAMREYEELEAYFDQFALELERHSRQI